MERDRVFRESSRKVSEELQALDQLIAESPDDSALNRRLSDVDREIKALNSSRDTVSGVLGTQLELLQGRLKTVTDQAQIARKKLGMFKTLDELCSISRNQPDQERRYQAYLTQLGEFATVFPEDTCAKSFTQVMNAKRDLQVLRWLAKASKWKSHFPNLPADYQQRIRDCEECRKEVTTSPLDDLIRQYHEVLTSKTSRTGTVSGMKASLKSQLADLYSPATFPKSYVLKMIKNEMEYYLPEKIDLTGRNEQERVYFQAMSYPGGPTDRVGIDVFELATRENPEAGYVKLTADLRRILDNLEMNNWEDQIIEIVSRIRNATDVDPFLRYSLILHTLELGAKGSPVLSEMIKQSSIKLPNPEYGITQPWMDPRDEETRAARERAVELLTRLPSLESIDAKVAAYQDALIAQISKGYEAVGWLHQKPDGKWNLRIFSINNHNGDLLVTGKNAGGALVWKKIGQISQGTVSAEIDISQSGAQAGDLIFVQTPALISTAVADR